MITKNTASNSVLVMGILNVTPDSFSDGGKFTNTREAVARAVEMVTEGADIIDVGGESTRPGAGAVSVEEEIDRVVPVIRAIRKKLPEVAISIDTYKSEVASAAILSGADMVNSLGGFSFDPVLADVIREAKCPIAIYHIKGEPQTMQKGIIRYTDVVQEVNDFFAEQIEYGKTHGVKPDQFILDPGIGFGKSEEHNLTLIRELQSFMAWKMPILIGVSRKSHLGNILERKLGLKKPTLPSERVEAGLAETAIAVQNGAGIIRTHDVLATKKFLAVLEELV